MLDSPGLGSQCLKAGDPWAWVEGNPRSGCVQTHMDTHKCRWYVGSDTEEGVCVHTCIEAMCEYVHTCRNMAG